MISSLPFSIQGPVWQTSKTVECLGACGYAPLLQLGDHYREHLTKEKVDALIEECSKQTALQN